MNKITNLCWSLLLITLAYSFTICAVQAATLPTEIATLTYTLSSKQLSLNEPVILNFAVQNNSDQPIKLDLGKDRKESFLFTITRPDGTILSIPPRHTGGLGRLGIVSVAGGQQYHQKLLLNEWTDFGSVGKYDIEVRLAGGPFSVCEGGDFDFSSTFADALLSRSRIHLQTNHL